MTHDELLLQEAWAWLAEDPDPATRSELEALLRAGDRAALEERFGARLEFGTAGIRGILGAGPGRMNRALVRRVTAGLGRTLLELCPDAASKGVAIGFDGRRLSAELAEEARGVLNGLGLRVHWVGGPKPTPLLAFAVLELGAAAGVMVTASHNPPEYNGYKVYWANGAQIIPPIDAKISAAISAVRRLVEVPMLSAESAREQGLLPEPPADLSERFLRALSEQALFAEPSPAAADLRVVYTPLHGVGAPLAEAALRRRGARNLWIVPEQREPDGRFPTIRFPNPEEAGALDLALELGRKHDADLILANDPDADRLAAVVRGPRGEWLQLTGNQLGALLGYAILERRHRSGALTPGAFVLTTVVSSRLLPRMAREYGVLCERTLTGFKWICNRALELEREGGVFLFGYEEALGYCVGRAVRDKDGIGAAAVFLDLAAEAAERGASVAGLLDEMARRFGLFATRSWSLVLPGAEGQRKIREILERVRAEPPRELGGRKLARLAMPAPDIVQLELEEDWSVTLRPSGTEPKLKIYLEVCESVQAGEALDATRARAEAALDAIESRIRDFCG